MLHKLACLMLCAAGPLVVLPCAHAAPFGHAAPAGGPGASFAQVQPGASESPAGWDGLPHALGLASASSEMGLSDSERLQLREQIRAAARDLYPDIYQGGSDSGVPAELLRAPSKALAGP
ncbi:hypothetical protein [Verticiella sediminum]|uniref:hypothetical protein n=1 Tax=Verticiella sediminum TaxID=1247510 RepID=UPI00147972BE|nr:hypothetical protein [Verticiella sediminum]